MLFDLCAFRQLMKRRAGAGTGINSASAGLEVEQLP
jgi:hypothetical protein